MTPRTWTQAAVALVVALLPLVGGAQQDPVGILGGLLQGLVRGQEGKNNASRASPVPAVQGTSVNLGQLLPLLNQSIENIDEPREHEIGRHLAAILLGAKPLVNDLGLQHYVGRMGRWISLQSTRPRLAWTFGVLDDPGYNAFAAPGGFVFVTRGLVERMRDESELAAVLAHEVAHVVQKHHLKALRANAQAGLLTQLLATQIPADRDAQGLQHQLLAMGREVYARGLDHSDELEADRMGVSLATASGFDPYGLAQVLHQLSAMSADNPSFSLILGTHPAPAFRLAQLEQSMGNRWEGLVIPSTQALPRFASHPAARPIPTPP